jgi:hypothetical protein
MKKYMFRTAICSAALLLGSAGSAVQATEMIVGNAGLSVGIDGGFSGSGEIGGVAGFLACRFLDANGKAIETSIGSDAGPFIGVVVSEVLETAISETGVDVNSGNLFDGFELGGIGGGGADAGVLIGENGLQNIVAALPEGDRQFLKIRCRAILSEPATFKADVVQLCLTVAVH